MAIDVTLERQRKRERQFESISPFELKNELIRLAQRGEQKSVRAMLDAGRGNPNWTAATPREWFFLLGQFAMEECRRVWDEQDLAGKPNLEGISDRFTMFAKKNSHLAGMDGLTHVINYGIKTHQFEPDPWVYELVDGIVGDNYPTPDRMLVHSERIVQDFLIQELCGNDASIGGFNLFAVEGATAAMCYIFDSLIENHLLARGDQIAVMVPIFPPYLEIPQLAKYQFQVTEIRADGRSSSGNRTWQYPQGELDKLRNASIKALFLVNPSNPPSVAMDQDTLSYLVDVVKTDNPNLIIVSDDVYSTFVDGYRSLLSELPHNTVGVYSLSKYFGVTGWRLGVIAMHQDHLCDALLGSLNPSHKKELAQRYATLTRNPEGLHFIDRMVADSRQVALNHTAGLSTPQQIQMTLFCVFALLDRENRYKALTKAICHRRMKRLYDGLGLPAPRIPNDADYYTEFDVLEWAELHYGQTFAEYLRQHYEPIDILFRIAESSSIVLLNGGGFHAPEWSIRVSLANLDDDAYTEIGHELKKALDSYVSLWQA